jgi:transposase
MFACSRYRLEPARQQAAALLWHCSDARYVWNLYVEQQSWWRPGRKSAPGYLEQARQLTAARAESPWLREGSQMVQQQALRDFAQAMRSFFAGTHGRPRWRKRARSARGTAAEPGRNVAAKAGLNREIARSGWGLLVRRTEDKAPGRVEKVPPAYTSQRCSACGHVAAESRESQALFRCVACGYACNADVNAARNIAAGHAVKARGGDRITGLVNREPQLVAC